MFIILNILGKVRRHLLNRKSSQLQLNWYLKGGTDNHIRNKNWYIRRVMLANIFSLRYKTDELAAALQTLMYAALLNPG